MPINQSRLITQTNAALLSLKALNTIRSHIRAQATYISQGTMSREVAYLELINLISDNEQLFPPSPQFAPEFEYMASTYAKIIHVISIEQNHFSRHASINARNAESLRIARDRKDPNRQRRTSHPHSVFESSTIVSPTNSPPPSPPSLPPDELTDEESQEILAVIRASKAAGSHPPFEIQTSPSQPQDTDYSSELNPDLTPPPKIQSYIPPTLDPADDIDPGDPDFDSTKPPPSGMNS